MILPEDLLHYLYGELGLEIPHAEIQKYWTHAKENGCPWANVSDGDHVPCALYGDSAKYSNSGEKVTCIFFSLPLWNPRTARLRIWLLFALESYYTLGGLTMNPLYRKVVESMIKLYNTGIEIRGRTIRFAITELKGDWEWHAFSMGLSRTWRSPKFCWRCEATKNDDGHGHTYTDFGDNPLWGNTQLSHLEFLARCIDADRPGGPCSFDEQIYDIFSILLL